MGTSRGGAARALIACTCARARSCSGPRGGCSRPQLPQYPQYVFPEKYLYEKYACACGCEVGPASVLVCVACVVELQEEEE